MTNQQKNTSYHAFDLFKGHMCHLFVNILYLSRHLQLGKK